MAEWGVIVVERRGSTARGEQFSICTSPVMSLRGLEILGFGGGGVENVGPLFFRTTPLKKT